MDKHIVIIAELRGKKVNPVAYELLSLAREIGQVNPLPSR